MSSINKMIIGALVLVPCVSFAQLIPPKSNVIIQSGPNQNIYQQIQQVQNEIEIKSLELRVLNLKLYQLKKTLNKSIEKSRSDRYQWVKSVPGKIPVHAVSAWRNFDGPVNICQANYHDGVHPGQLAKDGCRITYAGKAYNEKTFNVLTSSKTPAWKDQSALYQYRQHQWPVYGGVGPMVIVNGPLKKSGSLPVIGGHEGGHNLYVCRCMYKENVHIGKVVANNCNIGFQGKEVRVPDYEVLFL